MRANDADELPLGNLDPAGQVQEDLPGGRAEHLQSCAASHAQEDEERLRAFRCLHAKGREEETEVRIPEREAAKRSISSDLQRQRTTLRSADHGKTQQLRPHPGPSH